MALVVLNGSVVGVLGLADRLRDAAAETVAALECTAMATTDVGVGMGRRGSDLPWRPPTPDSCHFRRGLLHGPVSVSVRPLGWRLWS